MELSTLNLSDLRKLAGRIEKEIEKRAASTRAGLLKKLSKLAKEHGVSLDDLVSAAPTPALIERAPVATQKAPLPAKYVHPSNKNLAWSGRGRKPGWIDVWLANGGTLSALEVAAQKLAGRKSSFKPTPKSVKPVTPTAS
ncbi:H-NS histone family protein [Thauera sinica]|uniref:H-NS family nucleoid-associated regulatory protein n=1 Tax=Thauera sinica TaxID=2665146 RepID=A0ABW1AXL3_9RHOO|nr:H-NS histone family protein [Thauera sp. K11]ATE58746.1 DNA-binding protein [Thauera sp. K11]